MRSLWLLTLRTTYYKIDIISLTSESGCSPRTHTTNSSEQLALNVAVLAFFQTRGLCDWLSELCHIAHNSSIFWIISSSATCPQNQSNEWHQSFWVHNNVKAVVSELSTANLVWYERFFCHIWGRLHPSSDRVDSLFYRFIWTISPVMVYTSATTRHYYKNLQTTVVQSTGTYFSLYHPLLLYVFDRVAYFWFSKFLFIFHYLSVRSARCTLLRWQ